VSHLAPLGRIEPRHPDAGTIAGLRRPDDLDRRGLSCTLHGLTVRAKWILVKVRFWRLYAYQFWWTPRRRRRRLVVNATPTACRWRPWPRPSAVVPNLVDVDGVPLASQLKGSLFGGLSLVNEHWNRPSNRRLGAIDSAQLPMGATSPTVAAALPGWAVAANRDAVDPGRMPHRRLSGLRPHSTPRQWRHESTSLQRRDPAGRSLVENLSAGGVRSPTDRQITDH
jgi:hypothetical protein